MNPVHGQLQAIAPAGVVAFSALTLAFVCLWAPRFVRAPLADRWWLLPCAVALLAASLGGLVDVRGLLVLLAFALACWAAGAATDAAASAVAHGLMLAVCAGLFLHVLPGFENPRVLDGAVLGAGSIPYTRYLNFDKGMAGLFLLGVYAPDRMARGGGRAMGLGVLWRFAVVIAAVLVVSLAIGYVRWDPKLPPWWPVWAWSMVFLTAAPEEALFRGVAQEEIRRRLGGTPRASAVAMVTAGVLFGIAHVAGGTASVAAATVAGIGYGWIYAETRSIAAAILVHAGLNTVHFLFFSYPALASAAGA